MVKGHAAVVVAKSARSSPRCIPSRAAPDHFWNGRAHPVKSVRAATRNTAITRRWGYSRAQAWYWYYSSSTAAVLVCGGQYELQLAFDAQQYNIISVGPSMVPVCAITGDHEPVAPVVQVVNLEFCLCSSPGFEPQVCRTFDFICKNQNKKDSIVESALQRG